MSLTIIFIGVTILTSYVSFQNEGLLLKLLHSPTQEYRNKELYRLFTSGFVHADWVHLLINMFVLYQFGGIVEDYYVSLFGEITGEILYAFLYLFGIIFANLPTFFKHRGNSHYSALGASGAVAAVVFASIVFQPWSILLIYGIIPLPAIIAGVLYLLYSSYAARNANDNIGHEAHLYGAIFGFIFTILLDPELIYNFTNKVINRI